MSKEIRVRKYKEQTSSKDNSELVHVFDSIFVKIFLLGISIFILWSVYNSIDITFKKLDILEKAEKEVEDLRIQNLYLSISVQDMSTDKYLEKEARDRLNFGGTEEIVFVIPENVMQQGESEVQEILQTNEDTTFKEGFTFSSWLEFLIMGI